MGGVDQQNKSADLAPNWALWLDLLAVNVSQCAALSLNLDPLKADQAHGQALQQELQRRRLVVGNHADNGGFRVTGRDFDRGTRKREPRLPLADFVLWALARSWRVPDPLAHRFAPPIPAPAPAAKETPAMLKRKTLVVPYCQDGIYSLTEWADHLALAELAPPAQIPASPDVHDIAAVYAFSPVQGARGVLRLTPKAGRTWRTLEDVADWDECFISDPLELARHDIDGYLDQAMAFRGPWLVTLPGGLIPIKAPVLTPNEWDSYRDHINGCADLRWFWWFTLWEAAKAEKFPCFNEAGRRITRPQDITTKPAYACMEDLSEWLKREQPLLSLAMADGEVELGVTEQQPQAHEPNHTPDTAPAIVIKSSKTRTNPLSKPIELAMRNALDPTDPASVWAALRDMARNPANKWPLLGVDDDGETVKYEANDGKVKWIHFGQLRKRLARQARQIK